MTDRYEGQISQVSESPGCDSAMRIYDEWSRSYDSDHEAMTMHQSKSTGYASVAAEHVTDVKNCRVIDIGAGTGLSGIKLQQQGFERIDAIDGSRGMLEKAREKNIYQQIFFELIGTQRITSFGTESYDLAYASGVFMPGHLGADHFESVLATVKRGGLLLIGIRQHWCDTPYHKQLLCKFRSVQQEGLCQLVDERIIEKSIKGEPATVYVFRRL